MLRVRELVNLKDLPDQDAVVLIGEGTVPDLWLIAARDRGTARHSHISRRRFRILVRRFMLPNLQEKGR